MTQAILSELARVKVLFQLRAVTAAMGIPSPAAGNVSPAQPAHTSAIINTFATGAEAGADRDSVR